MRAAAAVVDNGPPFLSPAGLVGRLRFAGRAGSSWWFTWAVDIEKLQAPGIECCSVVVGAVQGYRRGEGGRPAAPVHMYFPADGQTRGRCPAAVESLGEGRDGNGSYGRMPRALLQQGHRREFLKGWRFWQTEFRVRRCIE